MPTPNASDVAAKWSQNLGSSGSRIQSGVMGVTVSPGQAAAKQSDLWIRNLQASQAKWKAKVAAVSTADWQAAMINKGLPRIAGGAQAAQPKFEQFMAKLLPVIAQNVAALPPRGDLEANIVRANQFIRSMAKFSN
jgi:hypothetical protein